MFSRNPRTNQALPRRRFIKSTALAGLAAGFGGGAWKSRADETFTLPFANGDRVLVKYPQKRPLIRLTTRPPQLETPFAVFNEGAFTPNDAFFVRYHLTQVPLDIEADKFRLQVKGQVNQAREFTLAELKSKFKPMEIAAVNECSGNGRGFSQPRVPGGQLGNGAMGNARWKGIRLKDLLNHCGPLEGARQVT